MGHPAGALGGAAEKGMQKAIPEVTGGLTNNLSPGEYGIDSTLRDEAGAAAENVTRNVVRTTINATAQTTTQTGADLMKDKKSEPADKKKGDEKPPKD